MVAISFPSVTFLTRIVEPSQGCQASRAVKTHVLDSQVSVPESHERTLRVADRAQAARRDAEELLRPAATLWRRISKPPRDKSVLPEPIEREIDRGKRHG